MCHRKCCHFLRGDNTKKKTKMLQVQKGDRGKISYSEKLTKYFDFSQISIFVGYFNQVYLALCGS